MKSIFNLYTSFAESEVVIIPVPWDATTSYKNTTSCAPSRILEESYQIELFDKELGDTYKRGIYQIEIPQHVQRWNKKARKLVEKVQHEYVQFEQNLEILNQIFFDEEKIKNHSFYVHQIEKIHQFKKNSSLLKKHKLILEKIVQGELNSYDFFSDLISSTKEIEKVNQFTSDVMIWVYKQSKRILENQKIPAVIGGDHSTPMGLVRALNEKMGGDLGILQIDAHCDLRVSYQGFKHSHASIMHNLLNLSPTFRKLVQIGVRDISKYENHITESDERIVCFHDRALKTDLFRGKTWGLICDDIVEVLPKNIYVSVDMDGLSVEFAPDTGTPVPGGLSYDHVLELFRRIKKSKKNIISFDICETGVSKHHRLNEVVALRLLYKLCGYVTN